MAAVESVSEPEYAVVQNAQGDLTTITLGAVQVTPEVFLFLEQRAAALTTRYGEPWTLERVAADLLASWALMHASDCETDEGAESEVVMEADPEFDSAFEAWLGAEPC